MEVTYQLNESEFDQNVFKSIKAAFKNRLIKISVSSSDTMNIVSEKEQDFYAKIQSAEDAKFEYQLSSDELEKFITDSIAGSEPDDEKFKQKTSSLSYQTGK